MGKFAAAAAAASSAAAMHTRELLSFGAYSRVKWRNNQRTYFGTWSAEEQQAVLRNLRNSFVLPYAAFRRLPLGEWRVVYWSAMRGADFLMPIAFDHYAEAAEPLKVSVSAMQKRICSMIGERIPLELLTRHALSPSQLAKIQVVLYSKPVAILAFSFCHLLHWLSFGQTQRDKLRSTASAGLEDRFSDIASSPTAESTSAFFSEDRMEACPETHQQDSQVKGGSGRLCVRSLSAVDLREQKLLSRGQEILAKGAAPYQRSTPAKRSVSQDPEKRLAESLLRFSTQKLGECNSVESRSPSLYSGPASPQSDWQVNAPEEECSPHDLGGLEVPLNSSERRLKTLALAETLYKQIVRKIKTAFGAFGVTFVCPLMVLAMKEATAWAIRHQMPKLFRQSTFHFELADRINALFSQLFDPQAYFVRFPAIEAHPLTQQLQKKLEKYLTNCPKPPVSASECFEAICSPLDLSGCTKLLQRQLLQLHKEVDQRSSLVQLGQTKTPATREMSHKDTDPQYKLLRLQQEQHELLERRNPRAFEPISNWDCPGQGDVSTGLQEPSSGCLLRGTTERQHPRVRLLTQQNQRHRYSYAELRGAQTIPRCASFTQCPLACTAEPTCKSGARKVEHSSGTSPSCWRSSQDSRRADRLRRSLSILKDTAQSFKSSQLRRAESAFICRKSGQTRGLAARLGATEGLAPSQNITAGASADSSLASDFGAARQAQATSSIAEESCRRELDQVKLRSAKNPREASEAETRPEQPLAIWLEAQEQDNANIQCSKLWKFIPFVPRCNLARAASGSSVKVTHTSTPGPLQANTVGFVQQALENSVFAYSEP
ncbi:hypothetical protein Esti_004797 [Eimeria stiedai]